jgi:hypothetical protein
MPNTDLMESLFIDSVSFMPLWRQEFSRQAGGRPRVADLGAEVWTAKLGTAPMRDIGEALKAEAYVNQLRGSLGTFYVWNPKAQYPQADPKGAVLGSSAVTIYALGGDNKSLRLAGLPVGYQITIGDFLAFDHGATPVHRCLHQFCASAVADSSGRIALTEVAPHIREGATTGLAVSLKKPAAEMMIVPGSYQTQGTRRGFSVITLTAVQVP